MINGDTSEVRALLTEIRDLLVPISDHYRGEYDIRQAARRAETRARVAGLVASQKRRAAWLLADGTLSQREISKRSTLDEGSTSKLFRSLRELGAVDGELPRRTIEL